MSNAAVRVANLIWRWRFPLSALCLGLSVLAASQLSSLAVSNSLEIWYPADDPELLNYRQFQRTYGNDEIVIAAVSRDDGFASEAATELIGSITDDLLDIDGVATVISLVTVPQSLGAARGRLLSDDGKTTALVLQMMAGEAFEARRHQILKDVAHAIEAHEMEPRLAGYGVVFDALNEESTTGTSTLLLDAIQNWQHEVTQMDAVGWSWSLVDALGIEHDERPSSLGSDALRRRLARIRQFSPVTTASMLAGDSELRVSFGAPIMSAGALHSLIEDIVAKAALPPDLELKAAGYSPLYTRIVDELVWSQVRGFSAAIVLIVVLLGMAMRSWRRILLALPANVIPVALTLGLMGLTGIPLDVASATIATVILGLVVDDTVHILQPSGSAGIKDSLKIAADRAGGTLLMTTIVLALGFLVLGLAEIRSVVWFGTLTSFAMIAAILADLLLLPALASIRIKH